MKLLLASVGSWLALASACGPKPQAKFDGSQIPSGQGWFCFPRTDYSQAGGCFRSEAECYAERPADGSSRLRCTSAAQAFCTHIEGTAGHCYPDGEACNDWRLAVSGEYSVSECRSLP